MTTSPGSHPQQPSAAAAPPRAQPCRWNGRPGIKLANNQVELVILEAGGVIAHFALANGSSHNALWESPWFGSTDLHATDDDLQRIYGDLGTGRFLHHFTGHALCLDGFGPATAAEVAAGSGLHGEASITPWKLTQTSHGTLHATSELPLAKLSLQRNFSLLDGEQVVRVDEQITNRGETTRPLHWVQHATVGPPLFGQHSLISSSVDQGIIWPMEYEGHSGLAPDRRFRWPHAPRTCGGSADLTQLFADPRSGFVAGARQPAGRQHGFVAAWNPALRLALLYVFSATVFPWVTFWEENRCRTDHPWSGNVQARGLEFGTTPLPLGNAAIDAAGPLLGAETSRRINPAQTIRAPWLMALINTSPSLSSIDNIVVEDNALRLHGGAGQMYVQAHGIREFLDPEREVA